MGYMDDFISSTVLCNKATLDFTCDAMLRNKPRPGISCYIDDFAPCPIL